MSYFQQQGDAYFPTAGKDTLLDELPVGNYVVAASLQGLFYQRVPSFVLPPKIYGDFEERAKRILTTFDDRPRATGVLMAGEKGSGKTQLARMISVMGYELGIPTILVNQAFHGDQFANLLTSVETPAIVLMDEFEKVYDEHEQEAVLTLLDGAMTSKKLFILTVNNKWKVNSHMKNRPGRLFYNLEFDGLDPVFVREYTKDNLDNQDHVELVVKVSNLFEKFSFDILKALIEEMNRYHEDPFEALKLLNAKPVEYQDSAAQYTLEAWTSDGVVIDLAAEGIGPTNNTPLNDRNGQHAWWVHVPVKGDPLKVLGDDDDDDTENVVVMIRAQDVTKMDTEKGEYEFVNAEGYRFRYTKKPYAAVLDYRHLADL